MVHAPFDTALEIMNIFRILAHSLTFNIRELGNIHSVTACSLHYNIESLNAGVIGNKCTYSESRLNPALEMSVDCSSSLKVKRIGEQQSLGLGIYFQGLIMLNHLLTPLKGISGVMSYTAKQRCISKLEVLKEAVRRNRIG